MDHLLCRFLITNQRNICPERSFKTDRFSNPISEITPFLKTLQGLCRTFIIAQLLISINCHVP
uniref:Uncharacterized protein n=1 Tax=Arundo donax TaxID=35708 RepID=A0A0A8Y1D4_ARUDO